MIFFTIVTPTILRSTLKRCIESVEKQTYPFFIHHVIVDTSRIEDASEYMDFFTEYQSTAKLRIDFYGDSGDQFGNAQRNYATSINSIPIDTEYFLYLDDDNYYASDHVLELIMHNLRETPDWGVFPMRKDGKWYLNNPPGNCLTDINQVFHAIRINGERIIFPKGKSQNMDGKFVEHLMKLSKPLIVDNLPSMVEYSNMNYGRKI